MLTSLFSVFYVTGEFHRFLHRGRAVFLNLTTQSLKILQDIPNEMNFLKF